MKKTVTIPEGTDEERQLYLQVAAKFGLKIAKSTGPIPGVFKIIKEERHCSTCDSITVSFAKLLQYSNKIWKFDQVVSESEAGEVKPLNVRKTQESSCHNCLDFLMEKSKLELAQMLLQSKSAALLHVATRKVLKSMREKEE